MLEIFLLLAAFQTQDQIDNIWSKKEKYRMPYCHEEFSTQIPSYPARMAHDHDFSLLERDRSPVLLFLVFHCEYMKTFSDRWSWKLGYFFFYLNFFLV